jgi:hypothetical protein
MKIAHTIVSTVAVLAVGVGGYHAVRSYKPSQLQLSTW